MEAQENPRRRAWPRVIRLSVAVMFAGVFLAVMCRAQAPAGPQPLQVAISASPAGVSGSYAVTLRFHNSGSAPLWLYRPVTEAGSEENFPGGSTVTAHLDPVSSISLASPAVATVFRVPGFPHPKLFAVPPGGNDEESIAVRVLPGKAGANQVPYWGAYKLSLAYSASYPNGDSIRRNLGVGLWSGSVMSNAVEITLAAPAASDVGEISGTTLDHDGRMAAGIVVSLSDDHGNVLRQTITGFDARFHFGHLPFGRYWVTVRREGWTTDTSFYEHADLSVQNPDAQLKLVMLDEKAYEGKQMLHKPVLIRVRDGSGDPVADATLAILWTDGSVTESEKIETGAEGMAEAELIPGTNYVTISKRHCSKEDQNTEIVPGGGIDSMDATYDCKK